MLGLYYFGIFNKNNFGTITHKSVHAHIKWRMDLLYENIRVNTLFYSMLNRFVCGQS